MREQLDNYLALRAWSKQEEAPPARAETQTYVIYNKGALVMNLLAERLGGDAVNRALRSLLTRYRFKSAPYPRSADLVAALRREARSAEAQALITDVFERITLYDLKVDKPDVRRRRDVRWVVKVPIEARKVYVGARGAEAEAPLDDGIPIGLFDASSGRDPFSARDAILLRNERSDRVAKC